MHSKLGTRSKLLPRHTEDMLDPQCHLSKAGIFSVVFFIGDALGGEDRRVHTPFTHLMPTTLAPVQMWPQC